MKIINYKTKQELSDAAKLRNEELYETDISFSFRLFEYKQCTELHIYYKH